MGSYTIIEIGILYGKRWDGLVPGTRATVRVGEPPCQNPCCDSIALTRSPTLR
jgi:hypothetical protein